jgi:WD40 repeat protein
MIKLWNIQAGNCIAAVQGHEKPIWSLTPLSGGRLASGSDDGSLKIWRLPTDGSRRGNGIELLARLQSDRGLQKQIWSTVAFGNDRLASGCNDGTISIWDTESCACLTKFCCNGGAVRSVTALGSSCLAAGCDDGMIKIWDLSDSSKWLLSPEACRLAELEGHQDRIRSLAALDTKRIASCSDDGTLKIWDIATQRCLLTFEDHKDWVRTVAPLGQGRLASGSDDGTIKIWGP